VLVVDASVLVTALADDGADGLLARRRLRGEVLAAPQLIDVEVASVLRRLNRSGTLTDARSADALADLSDLPLRRAEHPALLRRCWQLRHDLTVYDAVYVALAELHDAVLLTADRRLATSPGPQCRFELLESENPDSGNQHELAGSR
jgi:predicted nucleic acid-binding protein